MDTLRPAAQEKSRELTDPPDFWFRRFGRFFSPCASGWRKALMGKYPHSDPAREVRARLGGSEPARFLICESFAKAWAPVRPEAELPDHVSIQPTSARKRWDWIIDVILDPPDTPFLAASIGLSSADADYWRITTSAELIVFGGAAALFEGEHIVPVERQRFLEAIEWFSSTGVTAGDVLRSREIKRRFQIGLISGAQARLALGQLKADAALLHGFPGCANRFLARLAAYAAETRHAGRIAA